MKIEIEITDETIIFAIKKIAEEDNVTINMAAEYMIINHVDEYGPFELKKG